jgi:hypothetical protein
MSQEYHPLKLPGHRVYPENLEVRAFGKDEVAAYDRVRRSGSEVALRSLVGSTLNEISVEDLYEPDLLYLMMWHRVNSFMNYPMQLPWKCPSCENDNNDPLDLTKIVSKEIPEDYSPDGMTLDLPCGVPLVFRLPKVGDESRARKMLTALSVQNVNEDHIRKAEQVQLMEYDENFNSLEKWEIVNKGFGIEDVFTIEGFKQEFAYGPTTLMHCTCKKCEVPSPVGFRFSVLEFLPNNFDGAAIRARILPNRPDGNAAKRAKAALIPKTSVAPQTIHQEAQRIREAEPKSKPGHISTPEKTPEQSKNGTGQVVRPITPGRLMEEARFEMNEEDDATEPAQARQVLRP